MRLPLPQFSTGAKNPQHIAEVIETSTCEFLAQCLEPEDLKLAVMPTFGSIVKAADEETGNQILAVVYHATTAPIDSVHRARALGMSLDELREEQPQIFAMLKTEFKAAIIGFEDDKGQMYQYLPPRPPQIHQGVYQCSSEEIIRFSEQLEFFANASTGTRCASGGSHRCDDSGNSSAQSARQILVSHSRTHCQPDSQG